MRRLKIKLYFPFANFFAYLPWYMYKNWVKNNKMYSKILLFYLTNGDVQSERENSKLPIYYEFSFSIFCWFSSFDRECMLKEFIHSLPYFIHVLLFTFTIAICYVRTNLSTLCIYTTTKIIVEQQLKWVYIFKGRKYLWQYKPFILWSFK